MRLYFLPCLLAIARSDSAFEEDFIDYSYNPPPQLVTNVDSDDAWEQQTFHQIASKIVSPRIDEFGPLFIAAFKEKFNQILTKGDVMEFYRSFHKEYIMGASFVTSTAAPRHWLMKCMKKGDSIQTQITI